MHTPVKPLWDFFSFYSLILNQCFCGKTIYTVKRDKAIHLSILKVNQHQISALENVKFPPTLRFE